MSTLFMIKESASSLLEAQLQSNQLEKGVQVCVGDILCSIEACDSYTQENAEKVALLFCQRFVSGVRISTDQTKKMSNFLQVEIRRYQDQLDQGYAANQKNDYFLDLACLDIFLNAHQYVKDICESYRTKIASDLLTAWKQGLTTFSGKKWAISSKNPSPSPKEILSPEDAVDVFRRHPTGPLWIFRNGLLPQLGRFNQTLRVQDHRLFYRHHLITDIVKSFENEETPEVHYRQVDNNFVKFDPRKWDNLPIFRKKESRKTSDYRVEVRSVLQETHGHIWLELKDPDGNVYNVGWSDGSLVAGDPHEFQYQDELQDTLKTRYVITKENFEALKAAIEASKKNESSWRNSIEWTTEMLSQINIELPMSHSLNHWIFKIPLFGWMVFGLCWLISKGIGLFETSEEKFLHQLENYRQFQHAQGSNKVV